MNSTSLVMTFADEESAWTFVERLQIPQSIGPVVEESRDELWIEGDRDDGESKYCLRLYGTKTDLAEVKTRAITLGLAHESQMVIDEGLSQDSSLALSVGNAIFIRSEDAGAAPIGRCEVVLSSTQAFGTGLHATTALVLELIEAHVRPRDAVLDFGSGSGVLGIAALKLGAMSVVALDRDPLAMTATEENAASSGVAAALRFAREPLKNLPVGAFDLVLANIYGGRLSEFLGLLNERRSEEGRLILGGILAENRNEFESALARHQLSVQETRARDGFMAFVVG